MSEYVYAGLTSQTIDIFLADSSSTTGGGLAGLVFNTASLTAYYRKGATGAATAITLATQTVGGAWSSGGFVQIDSTNMPGVYRIDLPNAMVDTAGFVTLYLRGAANLVPTALRIDCRALPVDVKQISGDSGAADNAEAFFDGTGYAGANNTFPKLDDIHDKLPTRAYLSGTDVDSGAVSSADRAAISDAIWDDTTAEHTEAGTFGLAVQSAATANALAGLVTTVGVAGAGLTAVPWNASWDAEVQSECTDAITAASLATAVDLATVDTVVDAIKLKTDNLPLDPADQSAVEAAITAATSGLATASSIVTLTTKVDTLDDYVDTEVAAIKAKTDNLPSDPADASDIAASFVTVNSKLDAIDDYVDSEVAAIKVVTDRLSGMLVLDGLVYQYTTNALENAPSGGGGGTTTIAVYPLNATMPARVYDLNLTFYKNEDGTVVGPIAVTSRNADVFEPVDLSGRTLSVRFVDYEGTELLTVADADITVSGADDNQISFPVTTDLTGSVTELPQDQWHIWTLRDLTNGDNVLISGRARVLLS